MHFEGILSCYRFSRNFFYSIQYYTIYSRFFLWIIKKNIVVSINENESHSFLLFFKKNCWSCLLYCYGKGICTAQSNIFYEFKIQLSNENKLNISFVLERKNYIIFFDDLFLCIILVRNRKVIIKKYR